jgi:NAD(P)-dependent dehydrogenase (short-subunit alcohol dehydrogenase family)
MAVDFSLAGKVAIITGAALGGIGAAYAKALAEAGATVVCADIRAESAAAVAEAITAAGGTAVAESVDIADDASVHRLVDGVVARFGGVDILVNNAALMAQLATTTTVECSREDWDRAFAVNVTGAWQMAKACAPVMIARGGGRIVNVASAGAFPAESIYGITKLAVVALTTTLSRELGKQGITVNAIAPGITASDAGTALTPLGSAYREMLEARATVRAVGSPEELCGALLLLVSEAGSWISGQVLHVDGGFILAS